MTGLSGAILRRVATGRSKASLEDDLQLAKDQLEGDNKRLAVGLIAKPVLAH